MAGGRPRFYWDTCLFISWLKKEVRPAGEMEGVEDHLARFRRREISLMTSVLTVTEISVAKVPAGTERLFDEAMQRPNFTRISVDIRIAQLARELRNYYLVRPEYKGSTISVPDSLHLATAIIYRADEFHTFDMHNDGKSKALGLIPLSGDVGGHNLKICKPAVPPQMPLGLGEA
jgi:hypothetical protein